MAAAKHTSIQGSETSSEELIKLRGENGRLRNQVKCSEIELQNQKDKIEKMLLNGLNDGPDPRMHQLQQQMGQMEHQIRELIRENQRLQSAGPSMPKPRDE